MTCCACCGAAIGDPRAIGRRDSCAACHRDLHTCLQCRWYDRAAYNECHEPRAERVVDKEHANFCDYYVCHGAVRKELEADTLAEGKAKRMLDALFRKG